VQLRYKTGLTSEEYVTRKAWREATLERCPLHPRGGCGFARHTPYARVTPPGTRIARWYCRVGHCTFSLLPDCLAARLPGSLAEAEAVVAGVECAKSQEAAADILRPEVLLPGALRWMRRRVQRVHAALVILRGAFPQYFVECPATVLAFRAQLGITPVLPVLRAMADAQLGELPAPLGFRARLAASADHRIGFQHKTGTDPPPSAR
jgi:hypothetical protein